MFGTLGEAFDVGSRVFGLAHCDALDCVAVFDVATGAVSFFGPLFVGSGEQFKLNQRLGQFFVEMDYATRPLHGGSASLAFAHRLLLLAFDDGSGRVRVFDIAPGYRGILVDFVFVGVDAIAQSLCAHGSSAGSAHRFAISTGFNVHCFCSRDRGSTWTRSHCIGVGMRRAVQRMAFSETGLEVLGLMPAIEQHSTVFVLVMDISASHCRTASFTCTGVQDPHGLVQYDGKWFCLPFEYTCPLKQLPSSDSGQVVSGCCTAVPLTRTSRGWEFYSHAVYAPGIGLLLRENGKLQVLEIYEEGARRNRWSPQRRAWVASVLRAKNRS